MIAELLIAGVCAAPPLFDMSGPVCVDPTIECGCSECMRWDETPNAGRYEILRHNPEGTTQNVGTSSVYGGFVDDDGNAIPIDPQELWCFAKDNTLPVEGLLYSYEVRACSAAWTPACGPWSGNLSQSMLYRAAPYRVYP